MTPAAGGKPPAAIDSGIRWRDRNDVPIYSVTLWPNQSLTSKGQGIVMGITALGLLVPLSAFAHTAAIWGLVPFALLAFAALWFGFRRNKRNLRIEETLTIWRDEVRVERRDPRGQIRRWQSDPMRARVHLHKDAPIEDYLTLNGGGREIELGAFLAPEERLALAEEIEAALSKAYRA